MCMLLSPVCVYGFHFAGCKPVVTFRIRGIAAAPPAPRARTPEWESARAHGPVRPRECRSRASQISDYTDLNRPPDPRPDCGHADAADGGRPDRARPVWPRAEQSSPATSCLLHHGHRHLNVSHCACRDPIARHHAPDALGCAGEQQVARLERHNLRDESQEGRH